jgi:hypothetical protein
LLRLGGRTWLIVEASGGTWGKVGSIVFKTRIRNQQKGAEMARSDDAPLTLSARALATRGHAKTQFFGNGQKSPVFGPFAGDLVLWQLSFRLNVPSEVWLSHWLLTAGDTRRPTKNNPLVWRNVMSKVTLKQTMMSLVLVALPTVVMAQWADTGVEVGPGSAGATAGADGEWTLVDTNSRVNGGSSFGRGLAIGAGPDGISFSHSIGANAGGVGVGHNFNMTIGRDGTHVSGGHVVSQGGDSTVIAGGGSGNYGGGIEGGSTVGGFGWNTNAHSHSNTRRFRRW